MEYTQMGEAMRFSNQIDIIFSITAFSFLYRPSSMQEQAVRRTF
jgi:hypothetical protein